MHRTGDRRLRGGFRVYRIIPALAFTMAILLQTPASPADTPKAFELDLDEEHTTAAEEAVDAEEGPLRFFDGRVGLAFLAELAYDYADVAETDDRESGSEDDLYIDSIEVECFTRPFDWLETNVVAGVENIGKADEDETSYIEEAIVGLGGRDWPAYLVAGRRRQPFGFFEDRLLNGTITEDLYEIVDEGLTFGVRPGPLDLDVSITYYEGAHIRGNLKEFNTHEYRANEDRSGSDAAWIVNATIEPLDGQIRAGVFYNDEPGDRERNRSIGGAASVQWEAFTLDAEYITAIDREAGADGQENMESGWLLGLAFEATDDLELAVRFEAFDDDQRGAQDEVVDDRYLAGFNYDIGDYVILSVEYRHTEFEKEEGSEAASRLNECRLQLSLEF